MLNLADLKMRVGNEYSPEKISERDAGLKKNELAKTNFGRYS